MQDAGKSWGWTVEHCVDPCSVDIRKHIFPSFLLFFFFLFSKQMTNFRLFFSFEIVLEPNHKSSGEIKRPCKGFVKQHVSRGDLAELCKALQIQKVTIVTVYCCPHALLCLLPHRNWSKLRGRGHEGRLQSHTAGTGTLSSLLRTTVPLCCTSIAARHSSLSHPSCTVVPLCSVKSYPEKGDDNQLCPWERWPEKPCSFGWKKGYFDLNENLFQNISISAQYYLWKRGSNYPVFICWHWMIFIFHLFWFKNKSTVYNVYTSHIALKVNLKSSLNSLKLAIAIKTVFTGWEHWESLKLRGFLLQN